MKGRRWFWLALVGFLLSRVYILRFPPPLYSDVFHDYRRYAAMWQDGLTPYLKHFYEYPPATIPILYLPEILNRAGIGHYYENYRAQTFAFDLIIFLFILKTLNKLKTPALSKKLALAFYLVAPMVAKDFFYDGIDWAFIGSLTIALVSWPRRLFFWIFFWLSTAIKFMTAPLALPFFFLAKRPWFKELKAAALGFLIVWGLPLAIFRTSLSVMFVFHAQRGLKYASFPSFIVETINYFTQTETRFNQAPDFQLIGPVSTVAESIVGLVFPLSIAAVLAYGLWVILKKKPQAEVFALKLSLIYILTIFLTGKVFSQPFHLWLIPLIILFPFGSVKKQLVFMLLSLWLLVIDTTPWIKLDEQKILFDPIPLKFVAYSLRFIPMFILLYLSFKLPNKLAPAKK
ncbi:MAG: hypothetical protein UX85_C0005G0027 [Candidatus Beckwithbacteria bacterium GW2011_GWB1_47_15]|uniref:DUF2029 domain-containing protein n=1 Tax=Candidatus Beckwithbacteria bacterium GW2011_GWB1_47_15 TaxID=1618371 RepID=A0A0G1RUI9_9BACT|nr:MAG: hypothetical protein UY43_C0001G0757 [Candidatus Beckwithbacteria bacterium GW2011_GWC1_49_16]KKU35735.1 MAG: hypothetical protein UX50_C0002G0162 [Candidatus Beckwithbacteria bacterium GW2011_GWA1_46_30]KKU60989.1 MAG: hypothetical protein UX85_C0005G0027 [Candidatus Beckwithbacteria bacterium GW2011_GWB1_47_15]KKU72294.1 MAG: hypothetical protein UX97_C0001G0164 [Candidatus Beckwithbacteria bacterium GW2011_GWA2_47_25]KKW04946.1 MAG: hypothetical protein UY37_C0001G0050 [Candidatus Be